MIREQDHKLIKLFDKCHQLNNENANIKKQLEQNENCLELLRSENNSLRDENATYKNDIKSCEDKVEDLEQYGRRTSLRFHNVLMTNDDLQRTDDLVLNIINNKLNLENKLTTNDINRSISGSVLISINNQLIYNKNDPVYGMPHMNLLFCYFSVNH